MKPMHHSKLLIMGLIHFVIMFALMYSMVDTLNHVYLNINKVYMALIMTAPMLIMEVLMMGSMYENKKALTVIAGISIISFIFAFLFIRQQTFVNTQQFLRSMIPHHSSAILMCQKANIDDPEIKDLCTQIVETQREEIQIMEKKLEDIK